MAHVYASVADLKDAVRPGGSTALGTTDDAYMLTLLQSVSELLDEKMERSQFGSGFGPRIGTNRYDGASGNVLRLRDDLLSITSITIRLSTAAASTTTLVADTDYYALGDNDVYGQTPYRKILLHRQGVSAFGSGYRVTDIAGTWGYSNSTLAASATASAIGTTTTTSVTVSAGTEFSAGQTLLIDTEQLYVRAVSGTTLTVVRAANGTTAATHGAASAIAIYQYPSDVKDVALRLALRRLRARDAGGDGTDAPMDGGATTPRESEETIIRRGLFGLRLKEMV